MPTLPWGLLPAAVLWENRAAPLCACGAGGNMLMRWESSRCQLSVNINCSPDSHQARESEGQLG